MSEHRSSIKAQPWSGRTDGTRGMQQALIIIFRYIDVRFIYAIMSIVVVFYMIFRRQGFRAQYYLFHTRLHQRPLKALLNVYHNHYQFGQVILDRFAAYSGKKYRIELDDKENLFGQYAERESGMTVLFSHIGNFEMAGYFINSPKRMHILAYSGETETVKDNRYRMFCPNNINIIPITDDFSHIYSINYALQAGEIVCMAGDRRMPKQRSIQCTILGESASLPEGPFRIAATEKLPTLVVFAMKENWNTYRVYQKEIHINPELSRNELERDIIQQYAQHIENMVRKYPLQWYHYFDFWGKD